MMLGKQWKSPVAARRDGEFLILDVESNEVGGGYCIKVLDMKVKDELVVNIPKGAVNRFRVGTMQVVEWKNKILSLKLNIRKNGERIVWTVSAERTTGFQRFPISTILVPYFQHNGGGYGYENAG